jgi:hypothetical protein
MESMIFNNGYRGRYGYADQAAAIKKRMVSYSCYRQALNLTGYVQHCGISSVPCNGYAFAVDEHKLKPVRYGLRQQCRTRYENRK